jgi:hypothetical protein
LKSEGSVADGAAVTADYGDSVLHLRSSGARPLITGQLIIVAVRWYRVLVRGCGLLCSRGMGRFAGRLTGSGVRLMRPLVSLAGGAVSGRMGTIGGAGRQDQ